MSSAMAGSIHSQQDDPAGDARDIALTIALWKKSRVGARAIWFEMTSEDRRLATWADVEQCMARWAGRVSIKNSRAASFWQPEQLLLPGIGRRAA